jgi:hypothetical protein
MRRGELGAGAGVATADHRRPPECPAVNSAIRWRPSGLVGLSEPDWEKTSGLWRSRRS